MPALLFGPLSTVPSDSLFFFPNLKTPSVFPSPVTGLGLYADNARKRTLSRMNTPAHIILNLTVLARHQPPKHQLWVLAGAIIPDIPMVMFYVWEKLIRGVPEVQIWEDYFDDRWQVIFDLFHSFPLAIVGACLSAWSKWKGLFLFWVSVALHSVADLPLHHDDAHRHFFPLANWQFASPVSYWDPHFHGDMFTIVEMSMVLVLSLWMWRAAYWIGTKAIIVGVWGIYLGYLSYVAIVWL